MRSTDLFLYLIVFGGIVGALKVVYQGAIMTTILFATEGTADIMDPMNIWPIVVLTIILIATVDRMYFPTSTLVVSYIALMLFYGKISIDINQTNVIYTIIGTIIYLISGAAWLYVKWWSYLRDPKHSFEIERIPDGEESKFFINKLSYLYPHFLYWPFSIPHTFLSRLLYQVFEHVAKYFGGRFSKMVTTRKTELNNTKTPPVGRKVHKQEDISASE
jgi:hypothetical protein